MRSARLSPRVIPINLRSSCSSLICSPVTPYPSSLFVTSVVPSFRTISSSSSSSSSSFGTSSRPSTPTPTPAPTTTLTLPTPTLLRSATLALYKSHLQLAKIYDTTYKQCKALLTLPNNSSNPSFSTNENHLPRIQKVRQYIHEYRNTLLTYSSVSSSSSATDASTIVYQPVRSLSDTVRYLYRHQMAKNTVQTKDSTTLFHLPTEIENQLDAGFNLLREYTQILNITQEIEETKESYLPPVTFSSSSSTDTRKFSLPHHLITEASSLSPGILLMDHPAVGAPGRSLILVYDVSQNIMDIHKNEDWMIRGYIINRPFPYTVQTLLNISPDDTTLSQKYRTFGNLPIFHGGLEGNNQLSLLHTLKDLEGAVPINEEIQCPLYIGGKVDSLIERLDNKTVDPSSVKVLSGIWESKLIVTGTQKNPLTGTTEPILAWPDADLYLQVEGPLVWDTALLPPMFDTEGKYVNPQGLKENIEGYNYARFWHQNITWAYLAQSYGRSIQGQAKEELTNTKNSTPTDTNERSMNQQQLQQRIALGEEIESWSKLHAAVVGYARALAPKSPVSYLELYVDSLTGEETNQGGPEENSSISSSSVDSSTVSDNGIVIDVPSKKIE